MDLKAAVAGIALLALAAARPHGGEAVSPAAPAGSPGSWQVHACLIGKLRCLDLDPRPVQPCWVDRFHCARDARPEPARPARQTS